MGIARATARVLVLVTARDATALALSTAFAATAATMGMLVLVPFVRARLHAEGHRRSQIRCDEQRVESAAVLHLILLEGHPTCPSVADLVETGVVDPSVRALRGCTLKCVIEDGLTMPSAHCVPRSDTPGANETLNRFQEHPASSSSRWDAACAHRFTSPQRSS